MPSAYDFLDEPLASGSESPAPVNVFQVAGFASGGAVATNVLAFLLDPNERHGFGTTFVDALLTLLDGAPTRRGDAFDAAPPRGSSEWSVATETSHDGRRVDIVLEHDDLDLAAVIHGTTGEADAVSTDASDAARDRSVIVTVGFARIPDADTANGTRVVRYDELFDAADAALYEVGLMADQRSLELYAQFRESTSERIAIAMIEQEQQRLDELWGAIEHRQDQVLDFFTTVDAVNAVLIARSTRLQRAIAARLRELGVEHTTWVANAGDHAWGRSRGERALTYVGFRTAARGSIDLLVGWLPRTGTFGYAVAAHAARGRPPRSWDHIPLGLPLAAEEDAVADRFVALALRWMAGERPD